MLSLVSYGSSGESDDEDNSDYRSISPETVQTNAPTTKIEKTDFIAKKWDGESDKAPPKTLASSNDGIPSINSESGEEKEDEFLDLKESSKCENNMLSKLPPPVSDLRSIPWDQLSKLTYKSRAIRIMAPVIPEDVEEKKEKRLPSKTGTGLLALLPRPKNEFVAAPSVLKPTIAAKKPLIPDSVKAKAIPKPKLAPAKKSDNRESDSDGEADDNTDFFSLSSPSGLPETKSNVEVINIPLTSKENEHLTSEIPMPPEESDVIPQLSYSTSHEEGSSFYVDSNEGVSQSENHLTQGYVPFEQSSDELKLDNEALAALCGSRGLKRRAAKDDKFNLIDINGSQLTPDAQELLSKSLTADEPRPKRNNKDGPTSRQKKKHQIIYLAHQAKEMELELQNTWGNNRVSKKQTQAKYGF